MRDYVRARLGLAPSVHAMPCANEIKQHPFLEEEQHAKHKMFSHSIWDVAKAAKGIRILLLTAVSCRILLPPLTCGYYTSTCATPYGLSYAAPNSYYGSSSYYRRP
jgi:hypothetical protein